MCGIVGVISNSCSYILYKSLKELEYRGYDSAGLLIYDGLIHIKKELGGVDNLLPIEFDGGIGIAHTRWATEGEVNIKNTHPHHTKQNRVFVVHNGIIKNFLIIKEKYFKNVEFVSDTDSEIIAHLLEYYLKSFDMKESINRTCKELVGSYAVIVFDKENPTFLYAFSNDMPLYLSLDNKIISSDIKGLIDCKSFIDLEGKIIELNNELKMYDFDLNKVNYSSIYINKDELVDLGDYSHYMIKEINDVLYVIDNMKNKYKDLEFDLVDLNIVGCGSSYYASLIGGNLLNDFVECDVYSGGEFKYGHKNKKTILLSQSGETKDLLNIVKEDLDFILFTNNKNSSLAKKVKYYELLSGREISVASTKTFFAMVLLFTIIKERHLNNNLDYLDKIKEEVEKILKINIENKIKNKVIIISSGIDYFIGLEFALKLREISYINSYSMYSGELKHGSISIIDDETTVIGLCSDIIYKDGVTQALREAKSRGAKIIEVFFDDLDCKYKFIPMIVYIHLLSYYKAKSLNLCIDKPKNLAKSVTVE